MPAAIAECPTAVQLPVVEIIRKPVHLHDIWSKFIGATDENYWGSEFLRLVIHRYPKLLDVAIGKNRAHLATRSTNYLELESLAWKWRLWRICKDTPGAIAPPQFRRMFEDEFQRYLSYHRE